MVRSSIEQAAEVGDAPKGGIDDLPMERRLAFDKLSRLAPGPGADLTGLALDALFDHDGAPEAPPTTLAHRSERSEPVFGERPGITEGRVGAPANDDRIDRPGRALARLFRLRTRLRRCLLALAAVSLLLAVAGLVVQLAPAPANRYAGFALWPFALADLLLACAFLSGLADLTWEAHRREDGDRRDVADRAVQRAAETAGANELIAARMEEALSGLASLRAQCVELGTVPRLEPSDFALFSTKVDASFSRLSARMSEQRSLAEDRSVREKARLEAAALVGERTQQIVGDLADLRQGVHDLAASFGHERADHGPVLAAVETRIADLAGRLDHLQAGVTRSVDGLRLAMEALPAALTDGLAKPQVPSEPPPKTSASRKRDVAAPLDAEAFGEGLFPFLQPDALRSEGRGGLHADVRATLDAMFDLDALLLAWDAYRTVGEADFSSIYRPGFGDHMPAARRRLADAAFARQVRRFLDAHEQVLTVAARSGSEAALLRNLWSTDGRCYTLLAHAHRRLSSTDPA